MHFRIILIFLVTGFAISIQAQPSTSVSFSEPVADLGTIIDNQGPVNHRFIFTNKSSEPVVIDRVEASCGCTSTEWSGDSVTSGGEGFIEVQFDPYNRPGPFEKLTAVYFKGSSESKALTIKGYVKPAAASLAEEFPVKMGALRVRDRFLDLGTITSRKLYSKSFEVYNESSQILVFSDDMGGPSHITVTFESYTLKPGATGKMWVHYDVGAKNDLGYFSEEVTLFTYESEDNRKNFTVTATLLDVPASATPESPRIHFDLTEFDFGTKERGDTVNVVFPVRNQGNSTLRLKKIFGNCDCIEVQPNAQDIPPGESAGIDVRFITNERLGNQEKTITVFTDDPLLPVAILKLKGRLSGSRND